MQETTKGTTDFAEYLRPLRARWWLIAVIALVAAVGTYRYYAGKPVVYQASTSLYMTGNSSNGVSAQGSSPTDPNYIANQAILLRTEGVAVLAAKQLGYKGYPGALLGAISASPQAGTDFMTVTGTAPNAADAARLANAFANAYIQSQEQSGQQLIAQALKVQQQRLAGLPTDTAHADQRSQVASVIAGLQLQESLPTAPAKLVQPASLGSPSNSAPTSHAIYALILGFLIGVGLAYALDALDRRVKRVPDVEELYGTEVIAKVPWAAPQVCKADPREGLRPPLAESFRALRTSLQLRASGNGNGNGNGLHGPLRTILVASAVPGEGKSTIVRNLALAYLESGLRVVVVDCDLRRPDLTECFGVEPMPGLPEILTGHATVADCIQTVEVANADLDTIAQARRAAHEDAMYLVTTGGTGEPALRFGGQLDQRTRSPELAVLPSHTPSWNPAAIFGAGGFEEVLRTLRADYDMVIVDSSPLAAVSDSAPILPLVDGVLVVSRLKKTPTAAVREMRSVLERVPHTNVIGVVANDVRERSGTYVYAGTYNAKS